MPTPVDQLRARIAGRRVFVIAGAGVSKALSGNTAPDWIELLHSGVEFCEKHLRLPATWPSIRRSQINSRDLREMLSAAEEITARLNAAKGDFANWLRSAIGSLVASTPSLALAIRDLDVPIVSLNYDGLLDAVLGVPPIIWNHHNLVDEFVQGTKEGILHLHGHYERPESIVFGNASYDRVRADVHTRSVLRAMPASASLLFIGCGDTLDDPTFFDLFLHIQKAFAESPFVHYLLCRNGDIERVAAKYGRRFRLQPIGYGERHADLIPFLSTLRPPRSSLDSASSTTWRIAPSRLTNTRHRSLIGRVQELRQLETAWRRSAASVVVIIGPGGVGKTQLVRVWRERVVRSLSRQKSERRTLAQGRVFDWSFSSDGGEGAATTAEEFVSSALRWLDPDVPKNLSPWDKGARLAQLVKDQRTLLILDNLDAIQHPIGSERDGEVTDPALSALLRGLADGHPGMCVITTRRMVSDLEPYRYGVERISLGRLSAADGALLLKEAGAVGPSRDLRRAVEENRGSPLLLQILGSFLRDHYDGDVRRRGEIVAADVSGSDAGRLDTLITSYEHAFLKGGLASSAAARLLRFLALFDRAASDGELEALCEAKRLPGPSSSVEQRRAALELLARSGLVTIDRDGLRGWQVDVHPLVRAALIRHVTKLDRGVALRHGHAVLFDYLLRQADDKPETLSDMVPLYRAIVHGCASQQHARSLRRVFQDRIRRGDMHYSFFQLGAVMSDVAALSHFFEGRAWEVFARSLSESPDRDGADPRLAMRSIRATLPVRPVRTLPALDQAYVMNEIGSALRYLGRPIDAIPYIQRAREARMRSGGKNALGRSNRNLSKAYLQAGLIKDALKTARQALEQVSGRGALVERFIALANLGRVLHFGGGFEAARACFEDASRHHRRVGGGFTLQETHWCDLLLEGGDATATGEVLKRFLHPPDSVTDVLNHGLFQYSTGCLALARGDAEAARVRLDSAIESLRRSLRAEELGSAYVTRAAVQRVLQQYSLAAADLDSALSIARHGLKPLLADCYLESAWLALAQGRINTARSECRHAATLVTEMGYLRRERAIDNLMAAIDRGRGR